MNLIDKCIKALTVVLFVAASMSCSKDKTGDATPLTISYAKAGAIDVGPASSGVIARPTFNGNAPYNYIITKVTVNGELHTGENFTINSSNGSISIVDAHLMSTGVYRISISCTSNNASYSFNDVASINLIGAAPEGITISPSKLTISCAEAMIDSDEPLPTAQVDNNGTATIASYEIAKGSYSDFFAVSPQGEVSVVRGNKELVPGLYKVALKLTTDSGESFMLENVLEINLTAMHLKYAEEVVELLEETPTAPSSFASLPPIVSGVALTGLVYEIKKITPATDKIVIDPATGVLSVESGHGFVMGQEYVVDIAVVNNEAQDIFNFDKALTLVITGIIIPIENFSYPDSEVVKADAFEIKYKDNFVGSMVTFEFNNLDATLVGKLSIHPRTGVISAAKGNDLPVGDFNIQVRASNKESSKTTSFNLKINDVNKNIFTYIKYGNNIGLKGDYASQFRVTRGNVDDATAALKALDIPAPQTDIDGSVAAVWTIEAPLLIKNVKIDSKTGKLDLSSVTYSPATMNAPSSGFIKVTATTGKGTATEFSMTVPVFFSVSFAQDGVLIEYTPFALKINPKTGGRYGAINVKGVQDMDKFGITFRRTILYTDLGGKLKTGRADQDVSCFMYELWVNYYSPNPVKPGNADPMFYYGNENDLTKPLAYFDPSDLAVVVNPEKWKSASGDYANGVLSSQVLFDLSGAGAGVTNSTKMLNSPVILWFDEKF